MSSVVQFRGSQSYYMLYIYYSIWVIGVLEIMVYAEQVLEYYIVDDGV